MRIIAGSAKGTRLAPVPSGTRPLSDRAREGLFSSLGPAVEGASVLDLYAGTGALGLEALSRGAAHATFVDRSQLAVRAIRDNLERTRLASRARVRRANVLGYLHKPAEPVQISFLDPPYAMERSEVETALDLLNRGHLAEGWRVALTRPKRAYNIVIPVNWHVARRLEYGDALVVLYREV